MSSNDFDGPSFTPAGGSGADEQGFGAQGGDDAGTAGADGGASYPAPEGWGNDGFWRDSSIDSNYETGQLRAIPSDGGAPGENPGYSFWADGRGWESAAQGGPAAPQGGPAPSAPAGPAVPTFQPTTVQPSVPPATTVQPAALQSPGALPTAAFGGPGGPGGYGGPPPGGGPGGPGGYGPGGYGPGGPGGPPAAPGGFGSPGLPGGPGGPVGPGWPGGPAGPTGPGGPGRPGGPGPGPGGPGPGRHGGPRGPQGPGGRRKGSWWRHWTWKKAGAVAGGVFALFFLAMFGAYEYLYHSTTIPAALASEMAQNSTVYYSDGTTVMGTIGTTNRQDLQLSQMPKDLQNAYLAAEDKNFWTEGGISPTGILRATLHDVTTSGDTNGGSTITQEFVRNYYGLGLQQTASRKIKEIFIAEKLSNTKSKQWILQNYLNTVTEGSNAYGVQAAAEVYFGLSADKLSISQDAVLASMPQAPSTLPQESDKSGLESRWNDVLSNMVKDGFITQAQKNAQKFPALLTWSDPARAETGAKINPANPTGSPWEPYLLNVVYNELTGLDHISQSTLETGGLKVVTTVSRPMESEMYKAVNQEKENIKEQGYTVPSYVLTGAELQNPTNGEILSIYPGPGQEMSTKQCKAVDCDVNTAIYSREQVGSSFKPYVLSAAVLDGMNVKTSILNASPYLCVPPDSDPTTLSSTGVKVSGTTLSCAQPSYFPVENDGGEVIGNPKEGGATTVQNALAQSSNTAFTDLTHRVTTTNVIKMADNFGVNISATGDGGSNLTNMVGQVGLALGTASLTVNEQTTMLSAIDDNGVYHQAHVVKEWQLPNGSPQTPTIDSHNVFSTDASTNQEMDSQVQYAMEMTTVDGTGTSAANGLGNRQIIAKTGTTTNSHSGFFIGAIPQYSLVVGMFTESQASNSPESLTPLGGGGFGGARPAEIWNLFAQAEFANLPVESFQNPVFSGTAWNQVGKAATQPAKITCTVNGKKQQIAAKTCPSQNQNHGQGMGNQNCTQDNNSGQWTCDDGSTWQNCQADTSSNQFVCSGSISNNGSGGGNGGGGNGGGGGFGGLVQTATPTATTSPTATTPATPTAASTQTQAGFAVGDGLLALPGSLLWTVMSRRRRRRRGTGAAE